MPRPEAPTEPRQFTQAEINDHLLRLGHLIVAHVEAVARDHPEVLVKAGYGHLVDQLREQNRI